MSRFGQQWHGFAAWANTLLDDHSSESIGVRAALLLQLDELPPHASRTGRRCPKCGGQVIRTHPSDDAACLQCGFEPIQKRPSVYVFEEHYDAAATSRAAFIPEADHRNGAITVRKIAPLVSPDTCVRCGVVVEGKLRVNRCADCYRQYCSDLAMRAF